MKGIDSTTGSCSEQTLTVDLGKTEPPHFRSMPYPPDTTSLSLICMGGNFKHISWHTDGILTRQTLSYTSQDGGKLVMNILCGEVSRCSQINLTCSGKSLSDNTEQVVTVSLFPECTSIAYHSKQKLSTNVTSTEGVIEEQVSSYPMPYFGIVLGFSVCVGLAIISCLVVFLQKQLSTKSLARCCGGRLYSQQPSAIESHQQDMDNQRRSNQMLDPMPIMRFTKFVKTNNAQGNQKMNTLYEV